MAGLAWRAVRYGESLPDEQYGFAAGVVASALALPLFQAEFHRRRMATPYGEIYGHVWTDAICAAGALAFTGLSWIVLALLSELFHLLKIDFLRDLMDEGWFGWTFSGLAAGAALGTLRNQLKVLGDDADGGAAGRLAARGAAGVRAGGVPRRDRGLGPAGAVGRDAQRDAAAARLRGGRRSCWPTRSRGRTTRR